MFAECAARISTSPISSQAAARRAGGDAEHDRIDHRRLRLLVSAHDVIGSTARCDPAGRDDDRGLRLFDHRRTIDGRMRRRWFRGRDNTTRFVPAVRRTRRCDASRSAPACAGGPAVGRTGRARRFVGAGNAHPHRHEFDRSRLVGEAETRFVRRRERRRRSAAVRRRKVVPTGSSKA